MRVGDHEFQFKLPFFGGALGLLLAHCGTRGALGLPPPCLCLALRKSISTPAFPFSLSVFRCSPAFFFGLAPALKITRPDMQNGLKEGGRGSSVARQSAPKPSSSSLKWL
jgi:hypothetical protein